MSSKRRRGRNRGKRKELKKAALKTWTKLTYVKASESERTVLKFGNTVIPLVRKMMPSLIASQLVSVQPMTIPDGAIDAFKIRYNEDERKQTRIEKKKDKKRQAERARVAREISEGKSLAEAVDFSIEIQKV